MSVGVGARVGVGGGISPAISAAWVQLHVRRPAHPTPSFHSRSSTARAPGSGSGGASGGCGYPAIRAGVVSTAGVQKSGAANNSAPRVSFHSRSTRPRAHGSASGRASGAGGCPTVGAGVVSAACVPIAAIVMSAPDDHFAASPNSCVKVSGVWAHWSCSAATQLSALVLYFPPVFKGRESARLHHPRQSFHYRSILPLASDFRARW